MKASTIKRFLESPLGEALASDFAIMGGLEAVKAALRANRRTALLPNQQQGTTAPPAPPKDLHKALLGLKEGEKIQEVTEWMKTLHHAHKVELSKWELDDLNTLFALPAEARTQLISAVTGPTPIDAYNTLKKWVQDRIPNLDDLDEESKAIMKELGDWADSILAPSKKP